MENENCIFCKIASNQSPSYKIYENDYVYAFLDISKDAYGHTLVIPKKHFENVFDCDEKYLSEVIKGVKHVANHYKKLGFKGVNILNASGECAQQSVFHLHFHILPRLDAKEYNGFPVLPGTDVDLKEQYEKLKME